MKKLINLIVILVLVLVINSCTDNSNFRTISLTEYQSKMKAGWLGQMAGVGWGGPTEFKYNAMIIPEDRVPTWEDGMINQQYQDDIYVEMTFLKTLEDYGFDVGIRQAGIDFANSQYRLWHANKYGRDNLRAGIAPPFSGHPKYNAHADDIDYQIEADFSGLIAPGMPQLVIELGEKFGRIMNYGDGVYGGVFVGAMYAEAYFETDILKIIQTGLKAIPEESQYAETIRDVIAWHAINPNDWQKTWQLIENKYNLNHDYRKFSCNGTDPNFNIDAKLNGAYIVMGLLYGEGDMDQTIVISMRCGADSDCNPSNAAGILATSMGMENLPEKYKSNIDNTTKFSFTAYNFPSLLSVCENLAKDAVVRSGGKIEKNADGKETLVIPIRKPIVQPLQQCWSADEISENVNYTEEEMDKIIVKVRKPEDFVNVWHLAGPYSIEGVEADSLLNVVFPPELDGFNDWKKMKFEHNKLEDGSVNLMDIFNQENCVCYMKANVFVDSLQNGFLEIGSDDGVKVWDNMNMVIHENNIFRGHTQSEDVVPCALLNGWNTIIIKVSQGTQGWAASLVVTDKNHKVIKGIKYK